MKRYDSYKDSGVEWIGEIPTHWKETKTKYFSDFSNGYSYNSKDWTEVGIPVIRMSNIGDDGKIKLSNKNLKFVSKETSEITSNFLIKKGDLLISMTDMNPLMLWLGSTIIFDEEGDWLLNQRVGNIRITDNNVEKKYYHYLSNTDIIRNQLKVSVYPNVQTNLSTDPIKNEVVFLPPLSEQQQIVSFLDTKTSLIDSLIEKTQRKIELLKEKKTSLINEVVTKGLNPNVEMKDSGVEWIGMIPIHWIVSKFKYDSSTPVQYGINISGDKYVEEGIRFVRITDISEGGELNPNNGKYLIPEDVSKEFLLREFDVLFCRSGHTVGKTYLHTSDGLFTSGGYLVRFNFRNYRESKFIFYISKTDFYWDWIKLNTVVSTIENVNGDKYQNFIYPKPPISEQQQIVSYLDEQTGLIDKTISIEEKRIELLKEYRQSLISEVVTGKLKVV